jgi:hypothetical protein
MTKVNHPPRRLLIVFMDGTDMELHALETHESRNGQWYMVVEDCSPASPWVHHFPVTNIRAVVERPDDAPRPESALTDVYSPETMHAALVRAMENTPDTPEGRKDRDELERFATFFDFTQD